MFERAHRNASALDAVKGAYEDGFRDGYNDMIRQYGGGGGGGSEKKRGSSDGGSEKKRDSSLQRSTTPAIADVCRPLKHDHSAPPPSLTSTPTGGAYRRPTVRRPPS